jgi:hypothetical protein
MEHLVDQHPDRAQRMILRDARLRGKDAKHRLLLPVVSARHDEPPKG